MAAIAGRSHSPETIEAGLLAMALTGQNANAASRQLAAQGIKVAASTLKTWPTNHPERFAELQATHAADIERIVVAKARANALDAAAGVAEAIALSRKQIALGELDAARASKDLSMVMDGQLKSGLLLEGRPTSISETRDADDILKSLAQLVPGLVIDGTAEEVKPAELAA